MQHKNTTKESETQMFPNRKSNLKTAVPSFFTLTSEQSRQTELDHPAFHFE